MDKFKEIRPVVLGIVTKDHKILVGESCDSVKKQTFYRPLGGGIEFLEKSNDALKREFLEELNIPITINNFLGFEENIFTYEGKNAHEIIFYYSVSIRDCDYQEEYYVLDSPHKSKVKWIDIDDFKTKKKILYPEGILNYI